MPDQQPTGPLASHLALGAEGEERAAALLRSRGYRIVDRNVRAGGVELDLVAELAGTVVFVEVKTRRSRRHGGGDEAVGFAKQRRILRGAHAWLSERRRPTRRVRFDVVVWDVTPSPIEDALHWQLTYYEAAFDASG